MKSCVSLKELYDNGIQYLEFGGYIKMTIEDGNTYYDLYRDDDIEYGMLISDGEELEFGDWRITEYGKKYIVGTSLFGKQIYLTEREYGIAVFE